jgi:ATP-independent RNA helicase DbpA
MASFKSLSLAPALLQAVEVLGFEQMTPVQEHALPALLEGQDVIGQARTGSGKTVAFGLGLLSQLKIGTKGIQSLVLCPTRELADQVSAELRRLARFIPNVQITTLCGGVPVRTQVTSLRRTPQVVVGTPGRILDHLDRGNLHFSKVRVLVLDEADRMLDMGFSEDITKIAANTPTQKQTLLFSATFPDSIRRMSRSFQKEPVEITVDTDKVEGEIAEAFFEVERAQKVDAIRTLLARQKPESTLIFCHTRQDTKDVARELGESGHSVLALHGDMEQHERDEVMIRFANKSCSILVATDVAARGLDIKGLAAVVSYELPQDPDIHQHRIGRTGRAGEKGIALNLVAKKERGRAEAIEKARGEKVFWERLHLASEGEAPTKAPMVTLMIFGGKDNKFRPGDLLGALTGDVGLPASSVGKINIQAKRTYVAILREDSWKALEGLKEKNIKGRNYRVRRLG